MAQSVTFTLEAFKPGKLFGQPETRDDVRLVGLRVRRGPDRVGNARFSVEVRAQPDVTLVVHQKFPTMTTGVLPYAVLEVPAGSRSFPVGGSLGEMIVNAADPRADAGAATRARVVLNVRGIRSPDGIVATLIVAVLAKEVAWRPVTLSTEWTTLPDDPSAPTSTPAEYGVKVN